MDRITLLVPGGLSTVTGATLYDRHIVEGLAEMGRTVEVVELAGSHPVPDPTAIEAATAAWDSLAPDTVAIIDGRGLPAFAQVTLEARHTVGLIHHPTALETGHTPHVRAELQQIERTLFARLTRIIVTSDDTARRLEADFGVPAARIAVITPGTAPAPRCTGSGGDTCHVLSIGQIIPRKGHDVLIRALARLTDLDWRLTIVGNPEHDPVHAHSLRALADQQQVTQRVRFAGEAVGDDLEGLWRETDIFALATHYEGYGMVIAEALKRGLPVAVCGGGAAGALVPQAGGVVCTPGDDVALSKSLRRMIFDTALRADMAEAAWRAGQALPDWTTQARAFAAALR